MSDVDQDRNATLCQDFRCVMGTCASFPRAAFVDCTQRNDESEDPCEISVCDGTGKCVFNMTSSTCSSRSRSKGKAGVIAGAVAGTAVVLGLVAGAFFIARNAMASPNAYGVFVDSPAGAISDNPTFTLPTEHSNNLYA